MPICLVQGLILGHLTNYMHELLSYMVQWSLGVSSRRAMNFLNSSVNVIIDIISLIECDNEIYSLSALEILISVCNFDI